MAMASKGKGARPARARGRGRLRIAQLHWGYPPIIGGVETHLATMLPEMVRLAHRVELLTGSVEGHPVRYDDRGIKVWRTPLMDLNWLFKRGLEGLEEELRELFGRFLDEARPDVVHVHNMHYFSRPHAEAIEAQCRRRGVPLILTAHNVWDDVLYLELVRDIGWDHIIAVSHYIRKELIGAGCSDRRVTTVHHGVDADAFAPTVSPRGAHRSYPQLKGRPVVFHPARMGIAKGCDVSIKAFNIVRRRFPDALLVLAGTKNIIDWGATQQQDIAYFVNLVRHFRLEKNVLIDAFSLEQMPSLYAASDVVIYPSTAMEPFGLTMLEAMATARPMVVTRAGGMPEIISDGINGFVIPLKDFEELAGVVMRLLSDAELRRRFGETGRQMVEASYTKRHVAENTAAIYRRLLG